MQVLFMQGLVESIQNVSVSLVAAGAVAVGVLSLAVLVVQGMRKLTGAAKKLAVRSLAGAVLIGGMVVVGTDDAGSKPGTNDVSHVEGVRLGRRSLEQARTAIADDDVAAGWRVVSVRSNALAAATFAMPPHATVWASAQASGRGWGAWHIPLEDWRFTYGDVGWTNGFVWVEGYFRSKFDSRANEIRLLGERLALCPAANWSRYNLAASRAWCATNDVDGLVVTFENAAVGDDPTKIASVQMELFPRTGEIALRYDLAHVGESTYAAGLVVDGTNHLVEVGADTREVVFRRVHPDDWDMDGLPNSIDDTPHEPSPDAGYNQTDAWAMAAFPSNATEIATMGYAAWAEARADEPNRMLVGLQVSSPKGAWPLLLNFGDRQVMCDGKQEIVFAIDCGAQYAYSVSNGRLDRVRVFDGQNHVIHCEDDSNSTYDWFYPRYCSCSCPCDVDVHLESSGTGYLRSVPEVRIVEDVTHLFPNEDVNISAVVTNCHGDAYIDCKWTGGEGISFSNPYSLTTTVNWNGPDSVAWTSNHLALVTTYAGGYAVTNGHYIGVGGQSTPTTTFSVSCSPIQFLNDGIGGDRPERVYKLSLDLLAGHGEGGSVTLACDGSTGTWFYHDAERTIPVTAANPLWISTPIFDGFGGGVTAYMTSSHLGRATVRAVLSGDGMSRIATTSFQVIEPIRKLVNTEKYDDTTMIMNPCRLVRGTNAVLTVSVNLADGDTFDATNVVWKVVSGTVHKVSEVAYGNNWYVTVEPTDSGGTASTEAVIEAKFNDDPIQPRFVLPIVDERNIRVRAFVIQPPEEPLLYAWKEERIRELFSKANEVFLQAGVHFSLEEIRSYGVGTTADWTLKPVSIFKKPTGEDAARYSDQIMRLLDVYPTNDCLKVFFTGSIVGVGASAFAIKPSIPVQGIFVGSAASDYTLAHELGHALGLEDCITSIAIQTDIEEADFRLDNYDTTVDSTVFVDGRCDWMSETGRGFYEKTDTVGRVFNLLLMQGEYGTDKLDLPDGKVVGLTPTATDSSSVCTPKVGARYIMKNDKEVYTHEK